MLPFYMVSGHRMKAPYNTTQCSLTYRQKRNRNVPSQLSMSDMWFSICNIKIYIIKEGLIHAKLKFHSWGEIVLMQVLVTFSSSNMQTRDVFFSVVFPCHCVWHTRWLFSILWNSYNLTLIIVLWTSNCHQGLHRQTGEKQMGELSLLSQAVKWDEKEIHSSSEIRKQRNNWLINVRSYYNSLVLE